MDPIYWMRSLSITQETAGGSGTLGCYSDENAKLLLIKVWTGSRVLTEIPGKDDEEGY